MPEHSELDGYGGPALKEANLYLRGRHGDGYMGFQNYRLIFSPYATELSAGDWADWDENLPVEMRGRIVAGETGRELVGESCAERHVIEMRRIPKYCEFIDTPGFILEKWVGPAYFGSPAEWNSKVVEGTTLPMLGPYPYRGAYVSCLPPGVTPYPEAPTGPFLDRIIEQWELMRDEMLAYNTGAYVRKRQYEAENRDKLRSEKWNRDTEQANMTALRHTSNVLTNILSAELELSKDRASKSFTFTIDNPNDTWTSLANLQNRRVKAWLTNPSVESGGSDAQIAADPDPDTPLVIAYGHQAVLIFDGYTDQPQLIDGPSSEVKIKCQGLRKKLKKYTFPDSPVYDGWRHVDVAIDVLSRALFCNSEDSLATSIGLEIITAEDDTTLPSAAPGSTPLFSPAVGTSGEDFFETLQNFTGWILDDLIPVGATNSCWYWVPLTYYADSVYSSQGSPTVHMGSTYSSDFGAALPLPDATQANQGLGSLVAMDGEFPKQTLEELKANVILVIGTDDDDNPIVTQAIDQGSISDRTQLNYVGIPLYYILVSQTVNTQNAANQVCSILFANLTQAKTHLEFTLPDYYPQLGIGAPLTIQDYWNGAVESVKARFDNIGWHPTVYSVLRSDTS